VHQPTLAAVDRVDHAAAARLILPVPQARSWCCRSIRPGARDEGRLHPLHDGVPGKLGTIALRTIERAPRSRSDSGSRGADRAGLRSRKETSAEVSPILTSSTEVR